MLTFKQYNKNLNNGWKVENERKAVKVEFICSLRCRVFGNTINVTSYKISSEEK